MSNAIDHSNEYRVLPGLERHARADLGPLHSPIQQLKRLGDELGIELFIKRDDALPLGMGGNKVRQLEYYLGPALEKKADTVLITGAIQSNFVRLCAAACRKLGLHPVIQLEDRVPTDDLIYKASGNVLLDQLFGAEIHYMPRDTSKEEADENLDKLAAKMEAAGRTPYVIHLGIKHPPLGALGYVLAGAETKLQFKSLQPNPDHVVIPSGSGNTHAGFLAGASTMGWNVKTHGICVRREQALQQERIEQRVDEISDLLNLPFPVPISSVSVSDAVLQPGYGQLNTQVEDAIKRTAHLEGVLLDPVYSGRTMAGLIDLVARGEIPQNDRVLFIHTGGLPALFAYQNKLFPSDNI